MTALSALALAASMGVMTSSTDAEAATQYVGGGTWKYGTYEKVIGYNLLYPGPSPYYTAKAVYSQYYHPSKYHSATATSRNGATQKSYAFAGRWANAERIASGTGYAYYNFY